MKILVTYRTKTGNTKKIAEAIYSSIDSNLNKDIKPWDEVTDLENYEIVFVGFPIEKMGPTSIDEKWLKDNVENKKIALFVTHAALETAPYVQPWLEKCCKAVIDANAEILGIFNAQGELSEEITNMMAKSGRNDLEIFSKQRKFTIGQPDETRINAAIKFGKQIIKKVKNS